ncbi:MAG: Blue-light-activated protein [Syntrophorhabdus sp. PtaU1.Bin153]|nr:MAG: Blue-light-activated protein [Syntrophorhabdus sp. PtaU1.Bin153]
MDRLYGVIANRKDWLVHQVFEYARTFNFTIPASALDEVWRSLVGKLSDSLLLSLRKEDGPSDLSPDMDFSKEPATCFGMTAARKHCSSGATLGMFLVLMKGCRQACIELVREAGFDREYEEQCRLTVNRFFDRVEIGFVTEWVTSPHRDLSGECHADSGFMANDKDKYLTIFESTTLPVILLDEGLRIENMNRAAVDLIRGQGSSAHTCCIGKKRRGRLPWLADDLEAFVTGGEKEHVFERKLKTKKGLRYCKIKLRRVFDATRKPSGVTVLLDDITDQKKAQAEMERFASFPHLSPNPIVEIDASGRVIYFNAVIRRILDGIGQDFRVEALIPSDIDDIRQLLASGKESQLYREVRLKDRVFAENIYVSKQFNSIRIYARDVTDWKDAEDKLEKARDELEKQVEERTRQLFVVNKQLRKEIEVRLAVEGELRESKERLSNALESITDAFFSVHYDWRFTYMNREAERFWQRDSGELLGKQLWEIAPGVVGVPFDEECRKAMRGRVPVTFETLSPATGAWVEVRAYPSAEGLSVAIHDISDRKKTEKALKIANNYNRNLIEAGLDPLVTINPDGKISDVNRATEVATGYSRVELIGTDFSDYFTDPAAARRGYELVFSEGSVRDYELEMLHRDGHAAPVLYNATLYKDDEGGPLGVLAVARDMTETKRMEEERRRLATAVEQSAEGVLIMDRNGVARYVNPAFERISGYNKDDIIGRRPDAMEVDRCGELFKRVRNAMKKGDTWGGRAATRRKDGTRYHIDLTISPMKDASGKVTGYVAIGRDVTEQVRLEQQVRHGQKMEAIGTLAGGIAHDFNNIIAGIIGFIEMVLEDTPLDGPPHRKLELALKGAYRGRDLVKQILTFSRKTEPEKKPTRLGPVVGEVMPMLRASIPSTIEIRQHIQAGSDLVLADRTQIHQVLMNLCSNAAHAMANGGGVLEVQVASVDLGTDAEIKHPDLGSGKYIRLTVNDTGCGMEAHVLDRAFEPFFTTKGPGKGTGMGLSVVHGIVRSHGGAISVKSKPGQGSAFHVFLPIVEGDLATETDELKYLPRGRGRILLVDDEDLLVEMYENRLSRLGYKVIAKTSSLEALDVFRAAPERFDLVITDYTMPNMTGIDLSREMRLVRADIPIILCSGLHEPLSHETIREAGIREVLMKPVDKGEFADLVHRVLKERSTGASCEKNL